MSFLETDNFKYHIIILAIAVIICAAIGIPSLLGYGGCYKYSEMLKSCKEFSCDQKVPGFTNSYGGNKELVFYRQILGVVEDEFFASSTCHTIESDDTSSSTRYECNYKPETQMQVAQKSAIIFGSSDPEGSQGLEKAALQKMRASHAKRTDSQNQECKEIK